MIGEEKQAELEKYRILLYATLDYYLEHYTGSMVFDKWDPSVEYYLQLKQQTENNFQERQPDKLQQMLSKLVKGLYNRGDLHFERYLKEKTGYDAASIDLLNNATSIDLEDKSERGEEIPKCIVITKVETGSITLPDMGNIQQYLSTRPAEFNFPDCIRKVIVQTNGTAEKAITEVCIGLKGGFGGIYAVKGDNLSIRAFWKDKNTVVIETKKEYPFILRHDQVSSFQDVVKVEYVES